MNAFHYPAEAVPFLAALRQNNNRDWFAEHKTEYEAHVKAPTEALSRLMVEALDGMAGGEHRAKIFRIYRDVRFAKDKSPYKPYQHMLFAKGDHRKVPAAWFVGLEPDALILGAGKFSFEGAELVHYRDAVAGTRGAQLAEIVWDLQRQSARLNEPQLKRVPSGFDKDHDRADLLRRKGLALWIDLDVGVASKGDLVAACVAEFERLRPLVGWLEGV